MLRLIQKISLPHFRGNWGRSALVIGGTATGVALIVAIDIINVSVLANFRHSIETIAGPAALEVTLGTGEIGYPEHWVDTVREVEGVVAARPLVRGTIAFADRPEETVALFGIDLVENDDLASYQIALETDRRAVVSALLEDPLKTILVTKRFADEEGLRVGDPLTVTTPSGVTTLTIRGLLAAEGIGRAFGGRIAVMDLPAAQQFLGKDRRIDQIDIVVREGVAVDVVRDAVQKRLPETLTVDRPARRGVLYERIIASFQALLSGLSLLCLVAGVYIIYNTTSTGAVHRAAVIAGLRLIGADPHRLFRLLMLEALVLGVVGTGLGIPIGIALANLLTGLVSETMGVVFQLRLPLESLTIDLRDQAVIGAAGVAATLFASYFAARRVTRLPPLDVFRADLRSLAVRTPTARLLAWWLVLVAISGAALYLEVRYKSANWGNFASTLWFASSIVIAVPLVTLLAPLLERGLSRFFGAEGLMAAESLSRSPTRTGVTVAAIALVLTVGIILASMARSHRESVRDQVVGGMLSGDLAVSAVATEGGWLESPLPSSLTQELETIPQVSRVETLRFIPGHQYQESRVALLGTSDGVFEPQRFPPGWYREGDPVDADVGLRSGTGTLVSEAFADRFNRHLGAVVTLDTPTGPLPLTVVGVIRDYISDRGTLTFSSRLLRERWNDAAVSWFLVFAQRGASLDLLRSRIGNVLGDRYRIKILALADLEHYLADKIERAYAFTFAIQLLVAVVTVAGIFDLLLAAIWERRRELAIWRVIGADKRTVSRSVILESGAIGALGSLLGIAVGVVTTLIWIYAHYRHLLGYYLEMHFAVSSTILYVILIVSLTVLAGYAAARHATRESILEGIQSE